MTPLGEKSGDNVTRAPASVNPHPQEPKSDKHHLMKAAGVIALMTLISRVSSLVRDIVSAKTFGTGWQWDAFIYALMIPNLFRGIVGEGGVTSAFIPVYNEIGEKQGRAEAFRFANITISFLSLALFVFILVAEAVLNILLRVGFHSPTVMLSLELSRILFPYLWFLSIYALGMGVLNSHRHFLAPAFGPVIFDFVWIGAVLWVPSWMGHDSLANISWLSYAILFAGLLHVAVELPPLRKIGFRFRWIWDTGYDGLKKTWKLLLPAVLSFAIVQINITVGMTLGLMLGPGVTSSLWYGNRLMQFPLGVFALAMGTALLPMLAQQIARGEKKESQKTLSFALRSIFFIVIPSSVGLIVLREPIIRMLFERGEFNAVSTARSSAVLLGYTIGLFAFAGQKIMNSSYYAAHNSKIPMRTSVVSFLSNIVFSVLLMIPFRAAGLAVATSIAGIVQFGQLIYFYPKKVGEFPFREVGASFLRILIMSLVMGLIGHYSLEFFRCWIPGQGTHCQLFQVLGSIAIATMAYLGLCLACHVPEAKEAWAWFRKKRKNGTRDLGVVACDSEL